MLGVGGLAATQAAIGVAEAVHQALGWEIPLATGPVRVGASIGYAVGGPGRSPDDVLAEADAAMYARKHARATPAFVAGQPGGSGRP